MLENVRVISEFEMYSKRTIPRAYSVRGKRQLW